ncbi:MAG: cytidine/deoxycytidylate deaminase family protein [Armatimonadota bacterium]|nr:cytidine/deoxycytidylate deaminase family protein [bacterium]MCS7310367.1 cytidine/deoxycytidylate deaminase family protein [Armatimonadota bacterium]MDW8104835.1 cytidine/deoxycytidylate deaminase family protein [Armatimonadota bacterium]MDW8290757.1 cytidine/deoxycytidylate deaminase family protein [Armatimonadota bacterium]
MADTRPSWDEYFLRIAKEVATRATCPRRSVGAVIVLDRRILTTGYNGAPHGLAHCTEVGCKIVDGHCQRALHAEQNAILQAALNGVSTRGATVYVTCQPCNTCAKMLINAGIVRVVFEGDYPDPFAMELFEEAGIELVRLRDGVPEVLFPRRKKGERECE